MVTQIKINENDVISIEIDFLKIANIARKAILYHIIAKISSHKIQKKANL